MKENDAKSDDGDFALLEVMDELLMRVRTANEIAHAFKSMEEYRGARLLLQLLRVHETVGKAIASAAWDMNPDEASDALADALRTSHSFPVDQ